jgi:hypothetical protein
MSNKHSISLPQVRHQRRKQMNRDNSIDITDLQNVTLSVGDLKALVVVLEHATAHLLLPDEATTALERLHKLIDRKG